MLRREWFLSFINYFFIYETIRKIYISKFVLAINVKQKIHLKRRKGIKTKKNHFFKKKTHKSKSPFTQ